MRLDELDVPLDLETAAAVADVSRRTVARWISSGRLRAHKVDGRTYVIEADLIEVEHERRRSRNPGRPGARPALDVNAA